MLHSQRNELLDSKVREAAARYPHLAWGVDESHGFSSLYCQDRFGIMGYIHSYSDTLCGDVIDCSKFELFRRKANDSREMPR